jgi:superfamily II DNA helicase RecQ
MLSVLQPKMKKALPLKGGSAGSRHGAKSPKDLENVLKQYFGYSEFRGRQLEAIEAVLSGPAPVLDSAFVFTTWNVDKFMVFIVSC